MTSPVRTYIARVKLKNGGTVTAKERTESLSYARQVFQNKYGDRNMFRISELNEQISEMDEGAKTLSSAELQLKSLADQAVKFKKQKEQLVARRSLAKAHAKVLDANESFN